jgi:hypothetical protein
MVFETVYARRKYVFFASIPTSLVNPRICFQSSWQFLILRRFLKTQPLRFIPGGFNEMSERTSVINLIHEQEYFNLLSKLGV